MSRVNSPEQSVPAPVLPPIKGALIPGTVANIGIYLLLATVCFLAHYWHFRSFGLYEDDYYFALSSADYPWSQLPPVVGSCFSNWVQGRPLGFSIAFVLSWAGLHLGGLPTVYLIGYAIVLCNTLLLYSLVRRRFGAPSALYSALVFVLFPGDTTRALLTHALALQPALTFLLLACHLYERRYTRFAYLAISLTLITYESAFLPFFAAPLLGIKSARALQREWLTHTAVLLFLMLASLIIRKSVGEGRVVEALGSPLSVVTQSLSAIFIGPWTSLSVWFFRGVTALESLNFKVLLLMFLVSVVLTAALFIASSKPLQASVQPGKTIGPADSFSWTVTASTESRQVVANLIRQVGLGALMTSASYALAFTAPHFPPTAVAGRLTSVHFAATLGVAFFGGGVCALATHAAALFRQRLWFCLAAGCYFALMLRFGLIVQNDYVDCRNAQRRFWREVVRLAPDMGTGTILLFAGGPAFSDGRGNFADQYAERHSWADPLVLDYLYYFPAGAPRGLHDYSAYWKRPEDGPPYLFTLSEGWRDAVSFNDGRFFYRGDLWIPHTPNKPLYLPFQNTVLIERMEGKLVRVIGPITLAGKQFLLKPVEADRLPRRRKLLFKYLLAPESDD